jgi:hypothetical protein
MDGFKKNPKIACFKEGGQVGYKSRNKPCDKSDIKQDKAIVKKAVGQHEAMKHKGEGKTELKLKTGGRCKKDGGTVRKYKTGGTVSDLDLKNRKAVEMPGGGDGMAKIPGMGKVKPADMPSGGSGMANIPGMGKVKPVDMPTASKYKKGGEVIGMKKTAADKKDIAGIKKKGSAPKKAAPKTKQAPTKPMGMTAPEMPPEGELPMFEEGGNVLQRAGRRLRDNVMGTPEQNAAARQQLDRVAQQPGMMGAMERGARAMSGMGQATPTDNLGQANPMGPGAMSEKERELLKGVQAIGRACGGSI